MRHLIFLILLAPIGLLAQISPVGNVIFTDNQKTLFTNAFANPTASFPDNTVGYSDDIADIDLRAEQFRSDMSTNGIDRGAFVGFNNGINLIPNVNQNGGQPFPPSWTSNGYGPLFSNRNIHSAALKAYANDDATLAGYVLTALLQRANDVNLDFSNGGSRRIAGEPAKTNATYGTAERFPFERQDNFDAIAKNNPWFMLSSKMEQYLISYLIIYPLIQNSTLYTNNANTLNYWFNDYYRFIKFSADLNTSYWLGSNWRNFQRDWARPTLVNSAGVAYNADGTRLYSTPDGVIQSFNNRAMDSYSYVALFGKAFNDAEALDFTYDLFRGYLATAVLGDGTFMEHYRWDANPDYIFTNVIKWFLIAHTNEVAVEKGLAPLADKGKYYDHVETLGSDNLYNGATFTSTNGQPKTLRLILDNLSKYYRNSSTGGYQGLRNRATVSGGNITSSNTPYTTSHVQNLMQAIYLSYNPDDQAIRDFKNYSSSAGYLVGLNANMQANGDGPHSLGTAWGLGNALGGHIAFGETDAFAESVQQPPTTTPVFVGITHQFDSFAGTTNEQKWSAMRSAVIATPENDRVLFTSGQTYNLTAFVHLTGVNGIELTSSGQTKARLVTNQNNLISQPDGVAHNIDNLTIRNLHFESTAVSTGEGSPNALINISFGSGSNHLFEDNYFTAPNAVTNGIKYYTTNSSLYENITVRRSLFENLGRMGFETINHVDNSLEQIRIRNILTEYNVFRNTGLVRYGMGVSYSGRNDNVVTRFNTFHNNPTTAMELIGVEVGEIYGNIATGTGSPWHTVRLNVSSATRPNNNITIRDNYFDTTLGPWVIGATNLVSRNNYYRVQGNIFAQNYTNVRWENDTFEVRGFNPNFGGGTPTAFIQMQNNVTGLTNDINPSSGMAFINSRMEVTNNVPIFQRGDGVTPNVTRSEVYVPNAASQYSGANNTDVSLFVNGVFNSELGDTGANYGVVGYTNTGIYGVQPLGTPPTNTGITRAKVYRKFFNLY